jgi:hypothetical protein
MCKTIVILFFTKVRQKMHIRNSEHFENIDKFIYRPTMILQGQCELAHDWTMENCSRKVITLVFSKCERERIGWCLGPPE